jgi:hypothetical protein
VIRFFKVFHGEQTLRGWSFLSCSWDLWIVIQRLITIFIPCYICIAICYIVNSFNFGFKAWLCKVSCIFSRQFEKITRLSLPPFFINWSKRERQPEYVWNQQ